jgi:hypothetical protein
MVDPDKYKDYIGSFSLLRVRILQERLSTIGFNELRNYSLT